MKFTKKQIVWIALFSVVLLFSNCTRYKKMVYMQDRYDVGTNDSVPSMPSNIDDIVLIPGDNLYVNIYGIDINQKYMFDKNADRGNSNYNETTLYIQGYILDKDGFINLPLVGAVKVSEMTIVEARDKLQSAFDEYLNGATIDVRLLSYHITLLGEFGRPGTHTFYKRDVNLLDAIGEAADITEYGDRSSVLVIRKTGNTTKTVELDLTSSEFYSSPYFWLKPNDVIYVKPQRSKALNINRSSLSLLLTSLTTLIVILTYLD